MTIQLYIFNFLKLGERIFERENLKLKYIIPNKYFYRSFKSVFLSFISSLEQTTSESTLTARITGLYVRSTHKE